MEAGTKFVAVDNPSANKLTIHILAAVAEDERERISARTGRRWPPLRPGAPSSATRG